MSSFSFALVIITSTLASETNHLNSVRVRVCSIVNDTGGMHLKVDFLTKFSAPIAGVFTLAFGAAAKG